ncbi:hypothetical protein FDUTEX481_06632 [Tolypothrix sp. PCC 7601]|nr:hypothetical protein FDUTEX481_06632 [Tolypothrix sp. PCC 7601]
MPILDFLVHAPSLVDGTNPKSKIQNPKFKILKPCTLVVGVNPKSKI